MTALLDDSSSGPPLLDYADYFWGEKHTGYQVMYDNLKRGEDAVAEVAQFVKERLAAEEEYVKLLGKGAHKVSTFLSSGSCLDTGWSLTKATFEIIIDVHTMMVKNLQDLSREILKYKEEVTKNRKDAKQQDVIDAVNLMQTTTTCLQKAKETYQTRWMELEKLRKDASSNPKEITKAEAKLTKAREEYKSYVEKYENVRTNFEEKMETMCKFFQNHDRSHYANLQQFLMVYASHHQEVATNTQQLCGQLRESLQQLSVDDQIAQFVREKSTGTERPQPAVFEDIEAMAAVENELPPPSGASSSSSSAVLPPMSTNPASSATNDLLGLDILDAWNSGDRKASLPVQPSPTASQSSDSTAGPISTSTSVFGSSMGAGQKKLSMFLPKRKKTISQSSVGEEAPEVGGGLFKFRQNRRSKKSTSDLPSQLSSNERTFDGHSMDDARSTASSSRSEDKEKHLNGGLHLLDTPNGRTDEEGYSIPTHQEMEKEDTNWSSCSSDEEDELEMQQSRIRSISIKPAESAVAMNASVDELRDAIGHISIGSLGRSNTFDKDPWSVAGTKPPLFSQSMTAGSLKPLRPAHTADGRFRSNFSESEFAKSNVPLNFSASCGPMAGMARARPRSNTPTHNSTFGLSVGSGSHNTSGTLTKEGNSGSQDWGSSFAMNTSDSQNSLSGSSFNLSQSTANLMQATISEQRVPLAMAINEYSHVWFNGPEVTDRTIRTFGTVMISFAASSLPLLTNVNSEIEQLQFQLTNTEYVKTVVPNKQLLLPPSVSTADGPVFHYAFDRLGLANWLLSQQKERPVAAFYNVEVLRYELKDDGPNKEPPLLVKSYWKCEEDHTDLRVDYHLNSDGPVENALLNLVFSSKISGDVGSVISEPQATWAPESATISWMLTELSRHGESSGSLKARIRLNGNGPSQPSHTYAQFQVSDATISGMGVALSSSDTFHLSMVKKKVQAGKYFCEPEIRK